MSCIIWILITFSIGIVIKLKITGRLDLNKFFYNLRQHFITKKYNKKANDYNRLFPYFNANLIQSPRGELVNLIFEKYNTLLFYPDYISKKIFIFKNDNKRKNKANKIYLTELSNSPLGNGHVTKLEKNDMPKKSDYYCHKELSKKFKYFLELNELYETNYTFQEIINTKWAAELAMNFDMLKK